MRLRCLLSVTVLGCGFENTVGAPGGDDTAGDTDSDGDTLVDALDNCPSTPNLDQRDHDGDALGDVCDPCPHLGAATGDADGDGIGDACDPRVGIDTVVVFDGFYDPGAPGATWRTFGGSWSIADGVLRQSEVRGGQLIWQASLPRAHVDFAFSPLTVGPSYTIAGSITIDPGVSAITGIQGLSHNYGCSIAKDPSNRISAWSNYNGNQGASPQSWSADLTPGGRYRIVQTLSDQNRCAFSAGATNASANQGVGAVDGNFSLATGAVSGEFDYVFVVAIGN